jgi:fatty acid hydroxylase family protein
MTPNEAPLGAPESVARSRKTKQLNAWTALLSGGLWALALGMISPTTPQMLALGFLAGLVWANGFEYVYHRFILHWAGSYFARRHLVHHRATGTPEEAEHVTLGESPLWIVLLFVVNGLPLTAVDWLLGLGIASGMLLAFAAYFVAVEEIHWRIHLGESLPSFLEPARGYHLLHHDRPYGRYNVFLPLFDWLLGTAHGPALANQGHARPLR